MHHIAPSSSTTNEDIEPQPSTHCSGTGKKLKLVAIQVPTVRFQVLDSWRGIAATMIAVFHFMVLHHAFAAPLVRNAFLFVDFFFVLSGFVISHAYADRLTSWRDVARFALRRFGRIWPLHWLHSPCLSRLKSQSLLWLR